MRLYCYSCKQNHDIGEHPDTGICVYCGGSLVQDDEAPNNFNQNFKQLIKDIVGSIDQKTKNALTTEFVNIKQKINKPS